MQGGGRRCVKRHNKKAQKQKNAVAMQECKSKSDENNKKRANLRRKKSLYRLLNQVRRGRLEQRGDLGQRLVGLVPFAGLDEVAHGREQVAVVAGPQPRAKHDVLELRAVGDLRFG
jgi:hypothetical protein